MRERTKQYARLVDLKKMSLCVYMFDSYFSFDGVNRINVSVSLFYEFDR